MLFVIALRNIQRNVRRSAMTISAIAVGVVGILLFGAFEGQIMLGFQTSVVQRTGHLSVFRAGFFDFGAGNPGAFGIPDYAKVMELLKNDQVVGPMIEVITPSVNLFGVAGNFSIDTSKTFFGVGVVPADRDRMRLWDEYHVMSPFWMEMAKKGSGLSDADPTQAVIGVGMARILGLCEKLHLSDCPHLPQAAAEPGKEAVIAHDLVDLARQDTEGAKPPGDDQPRLDLLAATANGAPNVVSVSVARADFQGMKEADDAFVWLNLSLAQQLLYGRSEHRVNSIVLQLHRSEDIEAARRRLQSLIAERHLDLEVRDYGELTPFYRQAVGMFHSIFGFIALIMGVIVLFTVVNTMSMSVMERVNEIGTIRAMGVRRSGIRHQFVVEGWLLGAIGATLGVGVAAILAYLVNHSGMMWTPPGNALAIPLNVRFAGAWDLIFGAWFGLIVMATLAALVPANRAARMKVVDALRHV
jgi:putative ABC transport system permease protein